jgi:4-aminobutyrate aminotransferase-like enzyme
MLGVECDTPERAAHAVRGALRRGVILLPSGEDGRVLGVTPPLVIERDALVGALRLLVEALAGAPDS